MLDLTEDAVSAGRKIVDKLIAASWTIRTEGNFGFPGNADTLESELPAVRLFPPGGTTWFIELLTVPESNGDIERKWLRLVTTKGHFGLPSFGFISLAGYKPKQLASGVSIARPEMMALANLLEHPRIRPETISGLIEGREIKRSNKDLGRVLAIAYLATKMDSDAFLDWSEMWIEAIHKLELTKVLSARPLIGNGLRELLDPKNEQDLDEAHHTCAYGLLTATKPDIEKLSAAGMRLLVDEIEPLETELDKG